MRGDHVESVGARVPPGAAVVDVGIDNYVSVLTDPDIWLAMQATAHFLFWTIFLQTLIGFALAYLIDRKFRGHGFWTTLIGDSNQDLTYLLTIANALGHDLYFKIIRRSASSNCSGWAAYRLFPSFKRI